MSVSCQLVGATDALGVSGKGASMRLEKHISTIFSSTKPDPFASSGGAPL